MEPPISIFNWSLKRLLSTEPDTFQKAKAKILFTVFIFSLLKIIVAIVVASHYKQSFQLDRAIVMLFVYTGLLKLLLANIKYIRVVTHVMIAIGALVIWSNIFIYSQNINLITIQFIFMLILSSFYLLNQRFAIVYAIIGTCPVMLHLFLHQKMSFVGISPNELASPGYEIIVVLNFITIVVSHYLFQQAFMRNIAEKEALNVRLQLAVKEANQAAESKSDFLSTMSHELRTPLNSVIGISELLLNDAYNKEQEENLNILKFSANNLHSLINDILDFNKLGSGKLDLEAIPVNLNKLLREVSMSLRFQAVQKGIDFVLDIDDTLINQQVITDPTRITQIIYNLAGNAIKFTEKGRVSLSLKVLCIDEEDIKVKILITDTGIGISPVHQQAIFEPFTQASSSTTRNFGGTGLGLAIVKRLLYLFNSAIELESTPEVGSTFSFELMLKLNKESEIISFTDLDTEYDLTGLKILVAEDNPMNRLLLTKIFSKWNNQPVFAFNGLEAVEKISSEEFDVVLMDLHMPVMNGYDAAKAIRSLADPIKSSIRLIALTASVSGNLNDKIKGVGMDDYLLKPFKLDELYVKLKEGALNYSNI